MVGVFHRGEAGGVLGKAGQEGGVSPRLVLAQRVLLLVEAQPHPGGQRGLEADEPGVGEVVRGPRLARDGAPEARRPGRRAAGGHAPEQAGQDERGVGPDGVPGLGPRLLEDIAVAVRDARDQVGLHAQPLVGEGGEGRDHLGEGGFPRAQGDGQERGQLARQPELARVLDPGLDPHRLERLHRGDVPALLHRLADRDGPQVPVVVVLGRPDRLVPGVGEGDGRVHDDGGRGPAELLHRRRVDDRLEGRAHLAHGLGGPVELAPLEVVAAHHRRHGPRLDLQGEAGPLDLGLLLEQDPGVLPARLLRERLDEERGDGPPGEHLGHVRPARPGHLGRPHLGPIVADLHQGQGAVGGQDHAPHDVTLREGPVPFVEMDGVGEGAVLEDRGLGLHESPGAPVHAAEALAQRLHGRPLHDGIEGRVDPEAPLVDALAPVLLLEILADRLQEVGGDRRRLATDVEAEGELLGGGRLLGGDVLLLRHAVQDVVAALEGVVGVFHRGEAGGVLGKAGQEGGFGQGQGLDRPPEQELALRLHPVVAVAEVDLIAVEGEDLLLGEVLLDLEGEDDLLDLPLGSLLGREEEQPRELHGEGGEALAVAAGAEVGEGGSRHAPHVDPDVLPEVRILHGDDRVAQDGRDVREGHHHALLDRELAEDRAVGREHLGDDVRLVVLEGGDLGQIALEGEEDPQQGSAQDGRREEGGDGGAAQGQNPGRGEGPAGRHQGTITVPRGRDQVRVVR